MKKALLTTAAILLALCLNAQVSVWDGTAEPWTNGSGTEDDPYLIENAAQFAYLQYHKSPFEYFKLMTDVDLDNRDWFPIGHSSYTYAPFWGCVDGNGHTIYHLTATLFGVVEEGGIKNLTIRNSDIVYEFEHGFNSFSSFANFVPWVENCHNYSNIILDYDEDYAGLSWRIGGIAGKCGTIRNCSNHGNIEILTKSRIGNLYVGGVAGSAYIVEESFNVGEIIAESESIHCYIGGICGEITGRISYCYNMTDLDYNYSDSYIGGIAGSFYTTPDNDVDTLIINSCYNTGSVDAQYTGGILAINDYEEVVVNADNSYYINTVESMNDYGMAVSDDYMKSEEFVAALNADGAVFKMDEDNVNNGYPVFINRIPQAVDENVADRVISVYPNPASGIISVSFDDNANCHSVEIFSLDGRLVKAQSANFDVIDISSLASGLYVIKVRMKDGREYNDRIVKE